MKLLSQARFFNNVHHLIKMKIHLYHSHITGKILGYAQDFCNTKVTEKSAPDIPVIAHNLFCFVFDYITFAWCSKELKIAGEIKFIDSLKFYQKISFRAYSLVMNSIKRSLDIVIILTETKIKKQIFINKTIYSAYICKKYV